MPKKINKDSEKKNEDVATSTKSSDSIPVKISRTKRSQLNNNCEEPIDKTDTAKTNEDKNSKKISNKSVPSSAPSSASPASTEIEKLEENNRPKALVRNNRKRAATSTTDSLALSGEVDKVPAKKLTKYVSESKLQTKMPNESNNKIVIAKKKVYKKVKKDALEKLNVDDEEKNLPNKVEKLRQTTKKITSTAETLTKQEEKEVEYSKIVEKDSVQNAPQAQVIKVTKSAIGNDNKKIHMVENLPTNIIKDPNNDESVVVVDDCKMPVCTKLPEIENRVLTNIPTIVLENNLPEKNLTQQKNKFPQAQTQTQQSITTRFKARLLENIGPNHGIDQNPKVRVIDNKQPNTKSTSTPAFRRRPLNKLKDVSIIINPNTNTNTINPENLNEISFM